MLTINEGTQKILGENGWMSRKKQRFQVSPKQIKYAESIIKTLEHETSITNCAALEAETGIGKTLGYLVPALLHAARTNTRVAISTFTRQLQTQITAKHGDLQMAIDAVAELTGVRLKCAVRRGLVNYVSPTRVSELPDETELEDLHRWIEETETYLFSDYTDMYGPLPSSINYSLIEASTVIDDEGLAAYHRDNRKAQEADIVIINHSLMLLHAVKKVSLNGDERHDRPISTLIIDEADTVPAAAEALFNQSVSLSNIKKEVQGLNDRTKDIVGRLENAVSAIDRAGSILLLEKLPYTEKNNIMSIIRELCREIKRVVDESSPEKAMVISNIGSKLYLFNQAAALEINEGVIPIISWSKIYEWPTFQLVPINPTKVLNFLVNDERDYHPTLDNIIITSATLTDGRGDDFKPAIMDCGFFPVVKQKQVLSIVEQRRFEHDSNFGEIKFHIVPSRFPAPSDENGKTKQAWVESAAREIVAAMDENKRCLIQTLSFYDTEALAIEIAELSGISGNRLLIHEPGKKLADLVTIYKAREDAAIISPSIWEGIDLPNMIDALIMSRLPYSSPDHGFGLALRKQLERHYPIEIVLKIVQAKVLRLSLKKFRQGIGRGIRNPLDRINFYVLDPRFPRYDDAKRVNKTGHLFLDTIPQRFIDDWKQARICGDE